MLAPVGVEILAGSWLCVSFSSCRYESHRGAIVLVEALLDPICGFMFSDFSFGSAAVLVDGDIAFFLGDLCSWIAFLFFEFALWRKFGLSPGPFLLFKGGLPRFFLITPSNCVFVSVS